jgi:hypothetical protein
MTLIINLAFAHAPERELFPYAIFYIRKCVVNMNRCREHNHTYEYGTEYSLFYSSILQRARALKDPNLSKTSLTSFAIIFRMLTVGQHLDLTVAGYDIDGHGYAVSEGVPISIPNSRINDRLKVEIVFFDGKTARASIASVIKRRNVAGHEPPFDEAELDQIERSLPSERYVYVKGLGVYCAPQTVTVPDLKGKMRIIFVKMRREDKEYEAQITNIFDQPAEKLVMQFYSKL